MRILKTPVALAALQIRKEKIRTKKTYHGYNFSYVCFCSSNEDIKAFDVSLILYAEQVLMFNIHCENYYKQFMDTHML